MLAVGALGLLTAGFGTVLFADLDPPTQTSLAIRDASEDGVARSRGWIGVMVEPPHAADGFVRIRRVYPGMPAWRAGLLSGDLISEVDGVPVGNRSVSEVATAIRGELDTPVRLTILRESCPGSHLEFRLVRQPWADLEERTYWIDYAPNRGMTTIRVEPRLWWSEGRNRD
jgi:C-terminal processing protease CtpA/Prc